VTFALLAKSEYTMSYRLTESILMLALYEGDSFKLIRMARVRQGGGCERA
jgi:hypothetical protein